MAVKMVPLFCVSLAVSIIGSYAAGEFDVLHVPNSLEFSGSEDVLESGLKEVYSASLGMSVEENVEWSGLNIVDPFATPEAIVEVFIEGISSLSNVGAKSHRFPLTVDEYEPDTYSAMSHRLQQHFNKGGYKTVSIKLSDPNELTSRPDVFGDIAVPKVTKQQLQHLKYSVEEDYQFLFELEALKAITAKVNSGAIKSDNLVHFYNFRFHSLHALSDFHGPTSLQTKEAKKLLGESLQELSDAFAKAYEGSVLVAAVATDVAHTRRIIRDVSAKQEQSAEPRIHYSDEYPAVFNIILWFVLVFIFALVAIVYALMDMDPGRDSIIYRMTSTRMKKDN